MGLDILEFAISLERAFDLQFLDEDAEKLDTPGKVIDYIATRLPKADAHGDLTLLALDKLRDALAHELCLPKNALHATVSLESLLPREHRKSIWSSIGRRMGAKQVPKVGVSGWCSQRVLTLGQAAEYFAHRYPYVLKQAGEGWSRAEIAEVVHWHMSDAFGLRPDQYTENSLFVEDLGLE